MLKRLGTTIGPATAALILVFAQSAYAATSHLSIRYNADRELFHGKVRSSSEECVAGRTVKLFKKTADGRALQGRDRTNARGAWSIELMHAEGHYFAKVTQHEGMHNTNCEADRSKTIDVM